MKLSSRIVSRLIRLATFYGAASQGDQRIPDFAPLAALQLVSSRTALTSPAFRSSPLAPMPKRFDSTLAPICFHAQAEKIRSVQHDGLIKHCGPTFVAICIVGAFRDLATNNAEQLPSS